MRNQVLNSITIATILTLSGGQSWANEVSARIESQYLSAKIPVGMTDTNLTQVPLERRFPATPRTGTDPRQINYCKIYPERCRPNESNIRLNRSPGTGTDPRQINYCKIYPERCRPDEPNIRLNRSPGTGTDPSQIPYCVRYPENCRPGSPNF